MRERIGVVDGNQDESLMLCGALEPHHYRITPLGSFASLETDLRTNHLQVVILDLDSVPVSNQLLKNLRRQNPHLHVIGLSSRTFHPELQESMRHDISACLGKPIDMEELLYWLKSICER